MTLTSKLIVLKLYNNFFTVYMIVFVFFF